MEDTFKDIAVYSTLAIILFRKKQEKDQELTELERGKDSDESRFISRKHLEQLMRNTMVMNHSRTQRLQ